MTWDFMRRRASPAESEGYCLLPVVLSTEAIPHGSLPDTSHHAH